MKKKGSHNKKRDAFKRLRCRNKKREYLMQLLDERRIEKLQTV